MNGRSQAVRLPRDCRFEGAKEVLVCKSDDKLLIKPLYDSWEPLLEAIALFPETGIELERAPVDTSYKNLFLSDKK